MISRCQGLRWSGKGISNGRQRLSGVSTYRNVNLSLNSRQLSSATLRISQSSSRPLREPCYRIGLQQSRSLSLFGWGSTSSPSSSSKPSEASSSASLPSEHDAGLNIKASHSTSDTPEPSSILSPIPMSSHEPQILVDLEERISLPAGFDPSTIEKLSPEAERIGYMREVCGLDFGWGPSTLMQSFFEYFHIYTGATWTVSIIAVAILFRLSLVKLQYNAQMVTSRTRAIAPIISPLREKYTAAAQSGDRATAMKVAQEIKAVTRDANIGFFPIILPILIQIPMSFGGFRALRNAAFLPVPAFETESFLWHFNIALTEPIVLPILVASMTFLTVKQSIANTATSGATQNSKAIQVIMQYVLPGTTLIFMYWQACAVQVFFLTSTCYTYAQTYLFYNESFRARIGLPPLKPVRSAKEVLGGLNARQKMTRTIDTTARPVQTGLPSAMSSSSSSSSSAATASETDGQQKVSMLDKMVDTAKAGWSKMTDVGAEKQEKKRKEAEVDAYEYRERQSADLKRERRNQEARDALARKKIYGDGAEEVGKTGMRRRMKDRER